MAHSLVLDSAADLVETGVGQLHQMKRISDLDRTGEHRVERQAPRPRQVQNGPNYGVKPVLVTVRQPGASPGRAAALDQIKELPGVHLNERCRPDQSPPAADPGEKHLVKTQCFDVTNTGWVLDQRGPIGDHGVIDCVPITLKLASQVDDRTASPAETANHFLLVSEAPSTHADRVADPPRMALVSGPSSRI